MKTLRNKQTNNLIESNELSDLFLTSRRTMTFRDNLGTIPETQIEHRKSNEKKPAAMGKRIVVPDYVWYYIMVHLDLPFILTKLMSVSSERREFFTSLNSALFDSFLRTYGLFVKLRRTELAGKIKLVPFLCRLERSMVRAKREKALADSAYQSLMEKQRMKRKATAKSKRKAFGAKQMMS